MTNNPPSDFVKFLSPRSFPMDLLSTGSLLRLSTAPERDTERAVWVNSRLGASNKHCIINNLSTLACLARLRMAHLSVPLRPSSDHILIVRAPGARDQHGCHSIPIPLPELLDDRYRTHTREWTGGRDVFLSTASRLSSRARPRQWPSVEVQPS